MRRADAATLRSAASHGVGGPRGARVLVVEDDGVHSSEPVRSLPVDAERVVMTMPMGGG